MKGIILINAYYEYKSAIEQAERLKDEFENLNVAIEVKRNNDFPCKMGEKSLENGLNADFVVYLDKDKYQIQMLEKSGVKVFNSYFALSACDDKMQTFITLSNNEIKMPKTLSGLACYLKDKDKPISENTVKEIENYLGYPVIVKECYGSLGANVYKAENREELVKKMQELKCVPHLFQEYISSSYGADIRVMVVGGKVLGAMKRSSKKDFRSNVGLGGKGENYPLNDEIINTSKKIAEVLKLDYCGIDLLIGKEGYLVCEVNSNAFFTAFESVTGVNVAKEYCKYILKQIENKIKNE